MIFRLILLFTVIPMIELFLLIQIGKCLGALPTVIIVFTTGIAGGFLARSQGLSVYRTIRRDLQDGIVPTDSLLDGLFILIAGALLITPGLISDMVGFFIMIPIFRRWMKKQLTRNFHQKFETREFHFYSHHH